MRDALWIVDDAAPSLDVEVVQSRFRRVLGCEGGRVGEVTRARCTTLIIPPLEVVTLTRSLLSVVHGTSPHAGLNWHANVLSGIGAEAHPVKYILRLLSTPAPCITVLTPSEPTMAQA
jgi:hypothetical protein